MLRNRLTGWTCMMAIGLLLPAQSILAQHTHHPAPEPASAGNHAVPSADTTATGHHSRHESHSVTDHTGHHAAHASTASPDDADPREALFFERRQQDRMNFNEADVNFMVMMIPHHAQALIMSRLAPENGASPAVQRLAARILGAQSDEINLMQTWLRDRRQSVPIVTFDGLYMNISMEEPGMASHDGHADHTSMHHDEHSSHTMHASEEHENHEMHESHAGQEGHAGHEGHEAHEMSSETSGHTMHQRDGASHTMDHAAHAGHDPMHMHHDMPGMLTQEQLNELGAARGTEFDRLFLTYMIDHHLGAVLMVNELFGADGGALDRESYRLASDIYTEQITEIDLMRLMLTAM